jgi:hypothetical protein
MVRRGKTEKMSVTLPSELATEIRSAVSQGEVSSFFAEALEHYLRYLRQRVALQRGFGAWSSGNHPDLMTPQDSTSYVRSVRKMDRGHSARRRTDDAQ